MQVTTSGGHLLSKNHTFLLKNDLTSTRQGPLLAFEITLDGLRACDHLRSSHPYSCSIWDVDLDPELLNRDRSQVSRFRSPYLFGSLLTREPSLFPACHPITYMLDSPHEQCSRIYLSSLAQGQKASWSLFYYRNVLLPTSTPLTRSTQRETWLLSSVCSSRKMAANSWECRSSNHHLHNPTDT